MHTIVMSILCFLDVVWALYLNIYMINIYDDKLIIKSIFYKRKYEFKSIIVESDVSVRILNLEYEEIIRIANFIDPKSKIDKAYSKYCKINNIKHINTNNKISYNLYVEYFSIFGIIFSFIMFVFSGIFLYLKMANVYEDVIMILIFFIIGIIILIPSLIGILSYVNFEIIVGDNNVVIKNFIGVNKNYDINNLKCRIGEYIYKLKISNHKVIRLPYYLINNPNVLVKITKY